MKKILRTLGTLAAVAAVILGVAGSNVDAAGMSRDANPLGAIGVAIGAVALLKASELSD